MDEGIKMTQKSMISIKGIKVHYIWICKFLRVVDYCTVTTKCLELCHQPRTDGALSTFEHTFIKNQTGIRI